jgi:spermidine synthase
MGASGFAALGYQIAWTRQGALWLGHESAAVLAVVAAFFGGLAAGALLLGPRIDRSAHPARWYAGCEVLIGAWSLALALLLAPVTDGLAEWIGPQPTALRHWAVAFAGLFVLLLPATAAMGATLPAMERAQARMARSGDSIAGLYAANTLGAVIGVLAVSFWLVPAAGLLRTALVCALLNLACATLALKWLAAPPDSVATAAQGRTAPALVTLAATGVLGIGYEVLVVRVLSQVAENTVYTFALLLAVYLVGTAAGAAAYARWLAQRDTGGALRDRLMLATAGACLTGTFALGLAHPLKSGLLESLGPGLERALVAEALLAAAAFLLPSLAMGALFSGLCMQARSTGADFGTAMGVNTLGAAAAPLVFGVLLVPALGMRASMLLVAAGYVALALARSWRAPSSWVAAAVAAAAGALAPALTIVDVPDGGRVRWLDEGVMSTVSILEDASGVASLHIDNRQQEGSSATVLADGRQALLPILLHPAPRRALFLGLGTGTTATVAAMERGLSVDAVELLPGVIAASGHFTAPLLEGADAPGPRVLQADARRFVRSAAEKYDVIVSDNFHPARSGSGALYTVEHFLAVRERLAPGGLFCQWLPLHQLDLPTLSSIVASFLEAHPRAFAMLATNSLDTPVLGLVARHDGEAFSMEQARARLASVRAAWTPARFGFADEWSLLGSFVSGPEALARFADGAPLNTDDRPVVAYLAPRITYAPDSLPRERLMALLGQLAISPAELLPDAAPDPAARLSAYWRARNAYLEAGLAVRPVADPRAMLRQVRDPLLAALRTSADFRPAYEPLLHMAVALAASDPEGARFLLSELRDLQPRWPEAAMALRELREAEH